MVGRARRERPGRAARAADPGARFAAPGARGGRRAGPRSRRTRHRGVISGETIALVRCSHERRAACGGPSDPQRLAELRDRGVPRLLARHRRTPSRPIPTDCLEDWVAAGRARVGARRPAPRRSRPRAARPRRPTRARRRRTAASPRRVGVAVAGRAVARPGAARPVRRGRRRATCSPDRAWPDGAPTRNALDVHVLRLRRRLAPLGLEIRTVRSRGYLLQELRQLNGRTATTVTPSSRLGP